MLPSGEMYRWSITTVRKGTRRPEVFLYQGALQHLDFYHGKVDGWFGRKSHVTTQNFQDSVGLKADGQIGCCTADELVRQSLNAGFRPSLKRRIMALIAVYELSITADAYGRTSKIGDNAGVNYGVMQCNRHSSVISLLTLAGRKDLAQKYRKADKFQVVPEVRDFFGSVAGIVAQNKYFDKVMWTSGKKIADAFPGAADWGMDNVWYQRLLTMCIDTVIQNGGMYSPNNKPFWNNLTAEESAHPKLAELYHGKQWDKMLGEWLPYAELKKAWNALAKTESRRKTNQTLMHEYWEKAPDRQAQLILVAQWRARSSWSKYWKAVESRRMTDATGEGRVNGSKLDLDNHFGIGLPDFEGPDREEPRETFIKDVAADAIKNAKPADPKPE